MSVKKDVHEAIRCIRTVDFTKEAKDVFAERLKKLMKEHGVTQLMLSRELNITRQAISLYTKGQSSPDINILKKIANYFDVSTDYMLGISDTQSTSPDVKTVQEYTGLSESAVKRLGLLSYTQTRTVLSYLIEEGKIETICFCLQNLINLENDNTQNKIMTKRKILRHVKKEYKKNIAYDPYLDPLYLEFLDAEKQEKDYMAFKKWELCREIDDAISYAIEEFKIQTKESNLTIAEEFEKLISEV